MNAVMFIMLSMFDVKTLSTEMGLSDTYLMMQCEMNDDKFKYCNDITDSMDVGNMSVNHYPSIVEVPVK